MSKLAALAERIAAKKVAQEKKADELAARLDTLDAAEPAVFDAAAAVIGACEADLKNLEADMRALSNAAPLPRSGGG